MVLHHHEFISLKCSHWTSSLLDSRVTHRFQFPTIRPLSHRCVRLLTTYRLLGLPVDTKTCIENQTMLLAACQSRGHKILGNRSSAYQILSSSLHRFTIATSELTQFLILSSQPQDLVCNLVLACRQDLHVILGALNIQEVLRPIHLTAGYHIVSNHL